MIKHFDLDEAANRYQSAKPFKHIVLHDVVPEEVLNQVHDEFPADMLTVKNVVYRNKLENKTITSGIDGIHGPITKRLINYFNGPEFLAILQKVTGIERPLVADPKLMGGGLHESGPGGLLKLHIDFNRHYETGYDRRLNLLLYLNKDWKEEYGGHVELWPRNLIESDEVVRVLPTFGTIVIFNTDEYSWHGLPDPITCPEGEKRKSLAMYYYTNGRPEEEKNPEHHNSVWGARHHRDGTVYEADKDVEEQAKHEH